MQCTISVSLVAYQHVCLMYTCAGYCSGKRTSWVQGLRRMRLLARGAVLSPAFDQPSPLRV